VNLFDQYVLGERQGTAVELQSAIFRMRTNIAAAPRLELPKRGDDELLRSLLKRMPDSEMQRYAREAMQ
jgi:hypothetical protein